MHLNSPFKIKRPILLHRTDRKKNNEIQPKYSSKILAKDLYKFYYKIFRKKGLLAIRICLKCGLLCTMFYMLYQSSKSVLCMLNLLLETFSSPGGTLNGSPPFCDYFKFYFSIDLYLGLASLLFEQDRGGNNLFHTLH